MRLPITHDDRFPDRWYYDTALKDKLPASVDYRAFKVLPFAPRYAASILGCGVFDLDEDRFLSPIVDPKTGRKSYRLNTSIKGQTRATKFPTYARIILTLVEGPQGRNRHAHHQDHDCTHDT
ncbi:hypothetical protein ACLF3G_29080, partial [Falsiroseomonas sp. HC035]|uniref:hypothetical protein n=1 Tax=Falsiroseomonas sp. HC035 TaxID=3390999 RepID=UPI003D3182A3